MEHFKRNPEAEVVLILTNNPQAYVLQRADNFEIPSHIFTRHEFYDTDDVIRLLKNLQVDLIVLAGFLWKIPAELIAAYPDRILNIHPALLPAFGGKGMYGDAVHEAVVAAGSRESGITIHYVDEIYDHGRVFFQASFNLSPGETAASLAEKIHNLEHKYYPEQIARWVECKLSLNP